MTLELNGKKFGHLLVLERDFDYCEKNNLARKRAYWKCRCDCCGKIISANSTALSSGKKTSCKTNHLDKGQATSNMLFRIYKWNARDRGHKFLLSKEIFESLLQEDCYYCGASPFRTAKKGNDSLLYNGIDRVDNSIGHTIDNVVACCKWCNYAKSGRTIEEFKQWVQKIYNYIETKENN